jgi:hypothetical protein
MKWHEEFKSSGLSFEQRIGAPDKLDAAVGKIASNLAELDAELSRATSALREATPHEHRHLSFERRLELFASLCRARSMLLRAHFGDVDPLEWLNELLVVISHAGQLGRNAINASHSIAFGRDCDARECLMPVPLRGFIVRFELLDAADLLDIADYIAYAITELEGALLLLDGECRSAAN